MKRNEMANKIKELFHKSNFVTKHRSKVEIETEELLDVAYEILELVENSGMAPPKYEPFPGSDMAFETREWEPENA